MASSGWGTRTPGPATGPLIGQTTYAFGQGATVYRRAVTTATKVDGAATVRLSEVLAAVSLASDVGHDQPLEKSLRNAVVATRLGMEIGLGRADLSDAYYVALLRSMGCTANAHEAAALMGDDRAFAGLIQVLDAGDPLGWARGAAEHVASWAPALAATRTTAWFVAEGRKAGLEAGRSACEVATTLARRLGLSAGVQLGLDQVYERWDGRGSPARARGEELCMAARMAHLVDVVEIFDRAGGPAAAREVARLRSGCHFDPALVAVFDRVADEVLGDLDGVDMLALALDIEPGPVPRCPRGELAGLAETIADFADLKSPWTLGHSPRVAALATQAVPGEDQETMRLAALLHDLGRVAVPNGIWDKAGTLGSAERERVRLHSYYSERILARTPVFADVARLAGSHHERPDGSGYHHGRDGDGLTAQMRVLACADAYAAMTANRPHRPALLAEQAAAQLRAEAADGRLCGEATEAVLAAAGHERAPREGAPCGLTEREVEVLCLLARGLTNKQIADQLVVSPRTVGHHVAHVYDKIDRRTRAGAAMFAVEHAIIRSGAPRAG
jgi:HD-GYP domain-containing protein (c-di-GMP phosphodiesterase class II)